MYRDIAASETGVNEQQADGRTAYQKTHCLRSGFFDAGEKKQLTDYQ